MFSALALGQLDSPAAHNARRYRFVWAIAGRGGDLRDAQRHHVVRAWTAELVGRSIPRVARG